MAGDREVVAMDCEMVGLGPFGESGLARCSLVDLHGTVLYDKFIQPDGEIIDYRTRVSGVTPRHMEKATPFTEARQEVSDQICDLCPQPCKIPRLACMGSTRVWRSLLASPSHP
uniref:Interferon stimulated exonuclease 20 n=1 Tax=Equus asinus TaxID=9793 RepID=A0A9L0J3F1_EQUAS